MDEQTIHWGIIGLGKIAHKFAADLQHCPGAKLSAVASRTLEKAEAFSKEFGASYAYGAYPELLDCPELDVVYVATPHSEHYENTLMCLGRGVPVLCEKPLAINSRQAQAMIKLARDNQVFLMEALWTRFLPTTQRVLDVLHGGELGQVISIKADFGFNPPFDPQSRLFDRQLGGGALLDIGIYPVFLALLLLGDPSAIKAVVHLNTTRVDDEIGMILTYTSGQMAHLHASLRSRTKTEAFIYCEHGVINMLSRFHEPTALSIQRYGQAPEFVHFDYGASNGYAYEAGEVTRCLQHSKLESDRMPLSFSERMIKLLDRIRAEVGVVYPQDAVQ